MSSNERLMPGLHVHGGTYTNVGGDYNHYDIQGNFYNHDAEQGLQELVKAIATDAFHNSSARLPPPKCHPGTRKGVLNLIKAWREDLSLTDILWLYGAAGSGKSAIMQTISELYFSMEDLAASFFFSRGKPGCDKEGLLFATIAYQLALYVPGLREHINRAMILDPALHTRNISMQSQALIIEPLQKLHDLPPFPPLIVIDGIDECQDIDSQRRILMSIAEILTKSSIPLRFLIASRPELHIRDMFHSPPLENRTYRIHLDASFNPDRDIRLYLQEGFDEIARRNSDVLSDMEGEWPRKDVIEYLVEKASGQFIYPATVLKFVGADWYDPIKQLDLVWSPQVADEPPLSSPSPSTLYSNIDHLYTQILGTCPYPDNLSRILSLLLVLHCPQAPEVYANILGLKKSDVTVTLRGLHSLLQIPNDEEAHYERHKFSNRFEYDQTRGLRLHHATFADFLLDPTRCPGQFVIDLNMAHFQLAQAGSRLMMDWISAPWSLNSRLLNPSHETWGYLKHHLGYHLNQCNSAEQAMVIQELTQFHVVFPPERPHDDRIWNDSFHALHSMLTALAEAIIADSGRWEPQFLNTANFQSEHSHWTKDTVYVSPLSDNSLAPSKRELNNLYVKYSSLLDKFYRSALSSSKEILDLLDRLPGFIERETPVLFDWLEDICEQDANGLSIAVARNRKFIYRWDTDYWTQVLAAGHGHSSTNVVWMNPHFSAFLGNPVRARELHLNPTVRHLLDLCQIIKMIFSPPWLSVSKKPGALEYLDRITKSSLDSITSDSLEATVLNRDDKAKLLDVMKNIKYDFSCLADAPILNVDLIWSTTRRLLDWIHRQTSVRTLEKPAKRALVEISNRIYHQILEINYSSGSEREITVREPFLLAINRNTAPGEVVPLPPLATTAERVKASESLLALHGLRASLASFLTKADRAKDLYIPALKYHTQMAEICLDRCDPSAADITKDWKTSASHTEWRFHLTKAAPSPKILDQLTSIPLGPWLAEGLPSSERAIKVRSVVAILEWLKGLPVTQTESVRRRWEQDLARLHQFKRSKISITSSRSETGTTINHSEISSPSSSRFLDPA